MLLSILATLLRTLDKSQASKSAQMAVTPAIRGAASRMVSNGAGVMWTP